MLSFTLIICFLATNALPPPRNTENHVAHTKQPRPVASSQQYTPPKLQNPLINFLMLLAFA
jgi:hypothetical protein